MGGLSLVRLVGMSRMKKYGFVLHIEGVDVINGSKIYDIKPYVPWDIPKTLQKFPSWVTQEDSYPTVEFNSSSYTALEKLYKKSNFAPFYPLKNEDGLTSTFESVIRTIQEILKQDPRASHVRGTQGEYKIIFCNVEIRFNVSTKASSLVVTVTDAYLVKYTKMVD